MSNKVSLYIAEISKKYYKDYQKSLEIERPLQVEKVKKGVILPLKVFDDAKSTEFHQGGVLDQNNQFVSLSSTHRFGTDFRSLKSGYPLENKPEYRGETVIYGGVLYEFYGHVLLETMSRLWYYIKHNPQHYRVIFNYVPRAKGKFKEFFKLLDIPYNDETFITKPIQYKEVIIPEQASIYAESWHKDYLIPFDYMASKVKASPYKKIYFTRTKLTERNPVWGEKPIEKLFKKNGFKVFSPERLSLRKQISLMKGCRELATVSSSTYHNLLFAPNGVKLICLNRAYEPDYCQHVVDQAKELQAYYIDVALNPLPVSHQNGPWVIGFSEELGKFCSDNRLKYFKKRKTNTISAKYLLPFYKNWWWRNQMTDFNREDVLYTQERVKIVPPLTLKTLMYKVLSKITFGKTRKILKQKAKGESL